MQHICAMKACKDFPMLKKARLYSRLHFFCLNNKQGPECAKEGRLSDPYREKEWSINYALGHSHQR